jgi:site-specific recombinase XerD
LILTNRGGGFSLQPKRRELDSGEIKTYWVSDALEQALRNLYKKCGLKGCSSQSGRRSYVTNLITIQKVELEVVSRLLGHSDPEYTIPYVEIRKERLVEMYSNAFLL